MLKEKLSIERKKAVMITADFTAPTTESYAMAWIFGKTWYVELNAAKMVNSFCGQIMMSGSGN